MSQEVNPKAATQVQEIQQKIKNDKDAFSEFELKFIGDQVGRIEKYGDSTFFSEKQAALIERLHAELIRGEKVECQNGKVVKADQFLSHAK